MHVNSAASLTIFILSASCGGVAGQDRAAELSAESAEPSCSDGQEARYHDADRRLQEQYAEDFSKTIKFTDETKAQIYQTFADYSFLVAAIDSAVDPSLYYKQLVKRADQRGLNEAFLIPAILLTEIAYSFDSPKVGELTLPLIHRINPALSGRLMKQLDANPSELFGRYEALLAGRQRSLSSFAMKARLGNFAGTELLNLDAFRKGPLFQMPQSAGFALMHRKLSERATMMSMSSEVLYAGMEGAAKGAGLAVGVLKAAAHVGLVAPPPVAAGAIVAGAAAFSYTNAKSAYDKYNQRPEVVVEKRHTTEKKLLATNHNKRTSNLGSRQSEGLKIQAHRHKKQQNDLQRKQAEQKRASFERARSDAEKAVVEKRQKFEREKLELKQEHERQDRKQRDRQQMEHLELKKRQESEKMQRRQKDEKERRARSDKERAEREKKEKEENERQEAEMKERHEREKAKQKKRQHAERKQQEIEQDATPLPPEVAVEPNRRLTPAEIDEEINRLFSEALDPLINPGHDRERASRPRVSIEALQDAKLKPLILTTDEIKAVGLDCQSAQKFADALRGIPGGMPGEPNRPDLLLPATLRIDELGRSRNLEETR